MKKTVWFLALWTLLLVHSANGEFRFYYSSRGSGSGKNRYHYRFGGGQQHQYHHHHHQRQDPRRQQQHAGKDYYKVLGVSRSASAKEIRAAYRRMARDYHPDVNHAPDAQDKFIEIRDAYEALSDQQTRDQYDREQRYSRNSDFDARSHQYRRTYRRHASPREPNNGSTWEQFMMQLPLIAILFYVSYAMIGPLLEDEDVVHQRQQPEPTTPKEDMQSAIKSLSMNDLTAPKKPYLVLLFLREVEKRFAVGTDVPALLETLRTSYKTDPIVFRAVENQASLSKKKYLTWLQFLLENDSTLYDRIVDDMETDLMNSLKIDYERTLTIDFAVVVRPKKHEISTAFDPLERRPVHVGIAAWLNRLLDGQLKFHDLQNFQEWPSV